MRLALVLCAVAVAGLMPGVASAHVGRTLPVATNFLARVTGSVPGVQAKALDGDQTLWLRAPARRSCRSRGRWASRSSASTRAVSG